MNDLIERRRSNGKQGMAPSRLASRNWPRYEIMSGIKKNTTAIEHFKKNSPNCSGSIALNLTQDMCGIEGECRPFGAGRMGTAFSFSLGLTPLSLPTFPPML